jgi:subtilisin family serine protease
MVFRILPYKVRAVGLGRLRRGREQHMRMVGLRQRALVCALTALTVVGPAAAAAAEPQRAASADAGALPWVDGQVILALGPPNPDTRWLDRAIDDPFTLLSQVQGLTDFVRVCGSATGIGSMVVLQFADEETAAANLPALGRMPGVLFAQRDHRIVTTGGSSPADEPEFGKQWNLHNTGQPVGDPAVAGAAGQDIRVVPAWAQGARGQGQIIAVLDEAPGLVHPDLAPNAWINTDEIDGNGIDDDANGWIDDVRGWNYVTNSPHLRSGGHGDEVAGIAAAAGGNGVGITGVAPDAQLMPVDFISSDPGTFSGASALGAFAYAIANGATVINNSWGFLAPVGLGSPSMRAAVECARQADIVISWSSGNLSAVPESWPAYYPADNVLVTSSFDNKGCPYILANHDPALVDVMAPGVDVYTTKWGEYGWFGGTSAAAPHVAGVAALVRSLYPDLNATQTAMAIRVGSRRDFIEPFTRSLGFLSAEGALEAARTGALVPPVPGTDWRESTANRCYFATTADIADRAIPAYLEWGPAIADVWVPGGWPTAVPRPAGYYPGLPRP